MGARDPFADEPEWGEGVTETAFAQGRLPGRTYASRSFLIDRPASRDHGRPARFIHKVFDQDVGSQVIFDGEEWVVTETAGGRSQVKLLVSRESGAIKELWIQRVPTAGSQGKTKVVLNLKRDDAGRLIDLLRALDSIPVEGGQTVRVDDALVRDLFADPDSLVALYRRDPDRFRQLISDDAAARDVVAIAHRRGQVDLFRRLLTDPAFFDGQAATVPGRRAEAVWQQFFERNPWILGLTLGGQLLTSWSSDRLEQVVVGSSVDGVGKRVDALLRTNGRVRSMVFAEFKTHTTPLLNGSEYRSGCWAPSPQLSGGVAQAQGTVHRAVRDIGERLASTAADGSDLPGEFTYLIRPRSFLVVGQLTELIGEGGGDHQDRIRSFELYRRNTAEPEIITYDELLTRAEWFVTPPLD